MSATLRLDDQLRNALVRCPRLIFGLGMWFHVGNGQPPQKNPTRSFSVDNALARISHHI